MRITFDHLKSELRDLLGTQRVATPKPHLPPPPATPPGVAAPSPFAQLLHSASARRILYVLEQLFASAARDSQTMRPMAQLVQAMPGMLDSMYALFTALKQHGANARTMGDAVNLMELVAHTARARTQQLPAGLQHMGAQHANQWLRQTQLILTQQQTFPQGSRALPDEVLRLLGFALRERPATFENELFALPVLQRAGIDLTTYQRLAHQVEPIRLALLIIEATRRAHAGEAETLGQLLTDLRAAHTDPRGMGALVASWEQRLKPAQLHTAPPGDPAVHVPAETIAQIPQGARHALLLQALSEKNGVLPDRQWRTDAAIPLDIQAGLLATVAYPPGLHRLRLSIPDLEEDDEAMIEFLLYIVHGVEDEDDGDEAGEEKRQQPGQGRMQRRFLAPYEAQAAPPDTPVAGQIAVALAAPFILTQRYDPHATIPAPLQISFHFLLDLVAPATRQSREHFLTFAQSSTAAQFRQAVLQLGRQGIAGFEDYVESLQQLFARLESAAPSARDTFAHAKTFLRDEVLLYLMGKSAPGKTTRLLEGQPQGDVIASICATAGGSCARAGHTGDALIWMGDAARLAHHRPHFLQHLGRFLAQLRQTLSGHAEDTPASPTMDAIPVPFLPPAKGALFTAPDPDAVLFAEHLRVLTDHSSFGKKEPS